MRRSRKEKEMKIVVIGGTGLIGSKLVEKLHSAGHHAVAAAPATGVDTLTGEGLTEVLDDAQVVVDVADPPDWKDAGDFFQTASRNLLAAEIVAGVEHHVVLSVVGSDRLSGSAYFARRSPRKRPCVPRLSPPRSSVRRSSSSSSAVSPTRT
jgi:uncharacterized protein YbjT (DUF2867 family)